MIRSVTIIALLALPLWGQVVLDDVLINDPAQNVNGVGGTAVAAGPNGSFAVAWQDFNDYNVPVTEIPRVAVRRFAAGGTAVGPLNLFRGESRPLSIWTSDYLTDDIDLSFLPNGTLLVGVQHQGDLSIGGSSTFSRETGLGVVDAAGQIVDLRPNENGVILWMIATEWDDERHPRLSVGPSGEFFFLVDGPTFNTGFSAVGIQQFDANGNFVGNFFTPHPTDPGPNANHLFPDMANNGSSYMVVWQDGRADNNFDITLQRYTASGPAGGNVRVNSGDPANTINLAPVIAMNGAGNTVVVWADGRNGTSLELYGQRYTATGQTVGGNFQISTGQGILMDRPEVAMRSDGSFMVVWTDSLTGVAGQDAYRARARLFDAAGFATSPPVIVPNQNVPSGGVDVDTDGTLFYISWIDTRLNGSDAQIYAKILGSLTTGLAETDDGVSPHAFALGENYPNPFNPTTRIDFTLPRSERVRLTVYDVTGRTVAVLVDAVRSAGRHAVTWNGRDAAGRPVASGVYLYRLEAGDVTATRRMVLMK